MQSTDLTTNYTSLYEVYFFAADHTDFFEPHKLLPLLN